MVDFNRPQLQAEITGFEGRRALAYDDATSKTVEPGTQVAGWVSIGVGRNLVGKGLSESEIDLLWNNDVDEICEFYDSKWPWWRGLSDARQRALVNFGFVGLGTVESFTTFWSLLESGDFAGAATDFMGTEYARQLPGRAEFIAGLIRNG